MKGECPTFVLSSSSFTVHAELRFKTVRSAENPFSKKPNPFPKPLNPANVEKGMKGLSDYFSQKGLMIVNPRLNINPDSGELNVDFIKVKAPTKISVSGMEVFDADDVKKHFKMNTRLF